MRDSQKYRLYRAEEFLAGKFCRRFDTVADAHAYANKLLNDPWIREHYPYAPKAVRVIHKNGAGVAEALTKLIRLPKWAYTIPTLLHEITHIIVQHGVKRGHLPSKEGASHGRAFCRVMHHLIEHYICEEAATELKVQYKARGIKWQKTRTSPVMTAERLAVLAKARQTWQAARKGGIT